VHNIIIFTFNHYDGTLKNYADYNIYFMFIFYGFYLCTFDITQKHGPVSRHVDGDQYEEVAASVAAVVVEDNGDV